MRQLVLLEPRPAFSVGFTGTQRGMTEIQRLQVRHTLATLTRLPYVVHHGDCVGADSDFHDLVMPRRTVCDRVVIHPPEIDAKRAHCIARWASNFITVQHVQELAPKPYIVRNHDIVDASDFMIATPGEREEQLRSGTWATIRYARKRGVPLRIIYPDGTSEDSP
jgi:hypothetical protein